MDEASRLVLLLSSLVFACGRNVVVASAANVVGSTTGDDAVGVLTSLCNSALVVFNCDASIGLLHVSAFVSAVETYDDVVEARMIQDEVDWARWPLYMEKRDSLLICSTVLQRIILSVILALQLLF
jgi:hypothetical protein